MKRCLPMAGCVLAVAAAGASAQPQRVADLERFERQLEQIQRDSRQFVDQSIPANERAHLEYGGYLTLSLLSTDDSVGETHVLRQYELVGYARLNFDGAHEFYARARTAYNDFAQGDSFDGKGDDFENPKLERFHYRFDLQRANAAYADTILDYNIVLQGGRQLVTWGTGLTLSEIVDGAVATYTNGGLQIDALAGITWGDVVDFDISRPDFRRDTDRGLFGAIASAPVGSHRIYGYGLLMPDCNDPKTATSTSTGVTTRFDYDSYYLGIGATGALSDNLVYAIEGVYEGGTSMSNSFNPVTEAQLTQTEEDIEAYAVNVRLDYLFADVRRSRLSAELIVASGDSDRLVSNTTVGGNRSGTDDHAFNSLGLLNTGLAFAPSVSNLAMVRVGGSTYPLIEDATFRQMQAGADLIVFNKLQSRAPIDEPTSDSRYLGTEVDFFVNWQIASDVTFVIRYGIFFPGEAIEGDSKPRNFFYAGLTYAF